MNPGALWLRLCKAVSVIQKLRGCTTTRSGEVEKYSQFIFTKINLKHDIIKLNKRN